LRFHPPLAIPLYSSQVMNEAEARAACAKLAAGHPDRGTHQFVPRREPDGSWSVIKIGLPPTPETTPETRAEERPPTAGDARPLSEQSLGGPNVGPAI
jgi:hypothetical protein